MSGARAICLFALLTSFCWASGADAQAIFFSSEVRKADERLLELAGELAKLPEMNQGPRGARYGFRSDTISNQYEPHCRKNLVHPRIR